MNENNRKNNKGEETVQDLEIKPGKIELNGNTTLQEWCRILNCEEADLVKAISVIGNSVIAVDDFLILNRQKKEN